MWVRVIGGGVDALPPAVPERDMRRPWRRATRRFFRLHQPCPFEKFVPMTCISPRRLYRAATARLCAIAILVASSPASGVQQWAVVDPLQGAIILSSGATGAAELSGLTWAGGTLFYAVSDNLPRAFPLTITFDPALGTITSATLSPAVTLAAGSDCEGIAYNAANDSVYVSAEVGPAIREFSLADGSLLQTLSIPPVFSNHRTNLSLESLSLEPGHQALWTANEEALTVDGPVAWTDAGSVVRLQKFDSALQPAGQWAYVTDPVAGDIINPGRDVEVSGVVDLIALPSGQLLVLERELGFGLFRNRIYEVDFTGATDVSAIASLNGAPYTPVAKILLWEGFLGTNFEGISLGPLLDDGRQSLVLVSDNGGSLSQRLKALILAPHVAPTPTPTPTPVPLCDATPRPDCHTAGRSTFSLTRRGGERDRLRWTWRRGTLSAPTVFGDPTGVPPAHYALCVYDTAGGVEQLQMTMTIAGSSRWKALRTTGFRLADRTGSNDGITALTLQSGIGTATISARGKGSALGVPPPLPDTPLLSATPQVTVQLVTADGLCFGAVYPVASRSTAQIFRAKFADG